MDDPEWITLEEVQQYRDMLFNVIWVLILLAKIFDKENFKSLYFLAPAISCAVTDVTLDLLERNNRKSGDKCS